MLGSACATSGSLATSVGHPGPGSAGPPPSGIGPASNSPPLSVPGPPSAVDPSSSPQAVASTKRMGRKRVIGSAYRRSAAGGSGILRVQMRDLRGPEDVRTKSVHMRMRPFFSAAAIVLVAASLPPPARANDPNAGAPAALDVAVDAVERPNDELVLALARVCFSEADMHRGNDCAAIAEVTRKRARR